MKTISSLDHPLVKYWMGLKQSTKHRKDHNRLLIEGQKMVQDVANSHTIHCLISTKKELPIKAVEQFLVTDRIIKKLSNVEASDGVLAEVDLPKMQSLDSCSKIIVLDRIQDPGNIGTIIRSTLSLGWQGIFLLTGTCDPFNDKALRAAKGATFFLPMQTGGWQSLDALCKKSGMRLVLSDMHGEEIEQIQAPKIALVLGNEGQGILPPKDLFYQKVRIPMHASFDSLNVAVAGGILMYALGKSGQFHE